MLRHTVLRFDPRVAGEFLRCPDRRVGSRTGVPLEGGEVCEGGVLLDGAGPGALVGKDTGKPSAERATAVRQV